VTERTIDLQMTVTLDASRQLTGVYDQVLAVLRRFPGNHSPQIVLVVGGCERAMHPAIGVDGFDPDLTAELERLLGPGCVDVDGAA
jgi:hypothetical protein